MSQVVQDETRERLTRIVAATSLAVSSIYIVWRWGWTLDTDALWFSVPVALAETYGVLLAALLTYTAWTLRQRTPLPAVPGRDVDVFVTVADEPLATIRKTALAAREIRYPHTTWLLDDGHRDELRSVAEEIGIRYLRREDRTDGKAGNLNHALAHSSGEFMLQLDADHVALPHIVDRLVGYFEDERLAFVQSPQDFYNTDAFSDDSSGHGRQLWGDQQLFFNVLQPGKDRVNAAIFVGSCAMLRRAAIEDIGGFARHTTTMGTETSLLLHARGWRSAYVNENLAFGLAPSTAHAYHVQQLHRAQGGIQLLRHYQPLALPGLTAAQRAQYLETLTTPLGSVQRLILYLAPIVFLTTGLFPIRSSVGMFALFYVPAVLLRAFSFHLLTRGQGSMLRSDRYWMAKFFPHLLSLRAFVTPRRLVFTPRPDEAGAVPLRTVAPQLTLIGLTAAALAWATYARSLGYGAEVPGWGLLALFGAVVLALWHAGLAAHVVQLSLAGRHRRAEYRFAESLSVALRVIRSDGKLSSTDIAITEDLTATGLALRCMYPVPDGARVEMTLPLSGGDVQVRGHVVRNSTSETQLGTVYRAGVEFDATTRETRDAIELHCAQHAMPLEQQRQRQSSGAQRRLRDLRGERRVEVGMPARVVAGEGEVAEDLGVGLLEDVSPRGGRVLLDHPVSEGTLLTLEIPGSTVQAGGRVVFVHALQTGLGMRFIAGFQTDPEPGEVVAPVAPWYAAVVRLAARTSAAAASGSAAAAGAIARSSRSAVMKVAETSQVAAVRLSAGSRAAADALAAGSKSATDALAAGSKGATERLTATSRAATERLAAATRVASEKLAADSRAAVERAGETARASRAMLASVRERSASSAAAASQRMRDSLARPGTAPSGHLSEEAVERLPLEPMAPSARVSRADAARAAAAEAAALAAEVLAAAEAESEVGARAAASAARQAELAADAPAMEPVAMAQPDQDPERIVEMEIDGEFSFPFELTVGATLRIAESGTVAADIATVHAIVLGRYSGTLRASRSIRVGPRARVEGMLEAPDIEIAAGAVVNGLTAGAGDLPVEVKAPRFAPPMAPAAPANDLRSASSSDTDSPPARGPEAVRPPVPEADEPAAEEESAMAPDDEIFVASPVFTEGVSRG